VARSSASTSATRAATNTCSPTTTRTDVGTSCRSDSERAHAPTFRGRTRFRSRVELLASGPMSASTHSELPVERDASDGASEGSCAPAGCPAVSRVGEVIGDLEIESRIAEGAMGCVYRARRRANGERVAVKILHPDAAAEPVAVERFKREYETAFGFDHPHIVRVRGFGET